MILSKEFFPTLINNPQLAYFDSAASTQTPQQVIDAMMGYYTGYRSNVGRGSYSIARQTTRAVERARERVASLIHVPSEQLLFNSGATQGLNMVAEWNRDAPVVVVLEHEHVSNIAPWVAQGRSPENGRLVVIPVQEGGIVNMRLLREKLNALPSGSLFSFSTTSNVTGDTVMWDQLARIAKEAKLNVCLDLSQTISHIEVNLTETVVDWAVFSAHKMYGPTGIGALYVRANIDTLPPLFYGGSCVSDVSFNSINFLTGPSRHQCGTPSIASIIGFGMAAEIINYIGYEAIHDTETDIVSDLFELGITKIPGLNFIADNESAYYIPTSILTLVPTQHNSSDIAELLSTTDVAVRTGRVCAHPFADKISGSKGIVRVSIAPYNTEEDCFRLVQTLTDVMNRLNKFN